MPTKDTIMNEQEGKQTYDRMREMAFSVTMEQLGVSTEGKDVKVYGVIMEWGIDGGTITLPSYSTGDASVYLSTGGGVIGGGQHERVRVAAQKFVALGQTYLERAELTDMKEQPKTDEITFYLLTNKGRHVGVSNVGDMDNRSSEWLPMFEAANEVITELRLIEEQRK